MATIGNTAKPTNTQVFTGLNVQNAVALKVTMPQAGTITHVGVWMAGYLSACTAKVCVWNSSGVLLGESNSFNAPGQSLATGHSAEEYHALQTPVDVNNGQVLYIGFVTDPAEARQWGVNGTGTHYRDTDTGSWPSNASFSSSSGSIGAYATYTTNQPPDAPDRVSPTQGQRLTDTTPNFVFDHDDPDGDDILEYDIEVDNNSDFSSPIWSRYNATVGISGKRVTIAYGTGGTGGGALTRGTTYYWRVRTTSDDGQGNGAWSSGSWTFKINELPSATKVSPTASARAFIHNLATDLSVWTSGGAHAKPRFGWSYSDPDGDAQAAYRVRVYSASAGGSLLYDSGEVAGSATTHDATWAGVLGTEYWWTIDVKDSKGDWQGESSRTAFKMRWAQAIYEFAVPSGASSSGWNFTKTQSGSGQVAALFASASGASGAGRSAWHASIGEVTPNAYVNILVRLAYQSGTVPALDDMTFSYLASSIYPERWDRSPGTGWMMDRDVRRFGSASLKCVVGGTTNYFVRPFRMAPGDNLQVQPGTRYVLSAYVRTLAPFGGTDRVRLIAFPGGSSTPLAALNPASEYETQDSSAAPDGWQRLQLVVETDADTTEIEVRIEYVNDALTGSGNTWWVDAAQLEAGQVVSPWSPGMVAASSALDLTGLQVDASEGGILRLRGSDGGERDTVELGASGLLFGGDTEVFSPEEGATAYSVYRCIAARVATNQSIGSGSLTPVTFPTDADDPFGLHDTGSDTDRILVPRDGLYCVVGQVDWAAAFTAASRAVYSLANASGAQLARSRDDYSTAGTPSGQVFYLGRLTVAGDQWINLTVFQGSGAAVNISDARLSLVYLGE